MNKRLTCFLLVIIMIFTVACGGTNVPPANDITDQESDLIVVGFSQVGAESDWRKANTESMLETFSEENGYELILNDAQQKQTNQITAIRTFIQQDVDYIVLAPVTEDGWDTVLGEAKEAGIPVIVVDRMVNVDQNELFTCWVGSDFALEGLKVAEWLHQYALSEDVDESDFKVVNVKGTLGASSQKGRTYGLNDGIRRYGWVLVAEVDGDYTQAKAREEITRLIRSGAEFNIVYCENDNEAFGAIEAIENAGMKVGTDIKAGEIVIVSFDGISTQALQYASDGKIACIGECNPMHGPRVRKIIESIESGISPDKYEYVDEELYSSFKAINKINVKDVEYAVSYVDSIEMATEEDKN